MDELTFWGGTTANIHTVGKTASGGLVRKRGSGSESVLPPQSLSPHIWEDLTRGLSQCDLQCVPHIAIPPHWEDHAQGLQHLLLCSLPHS